MLNCIHIFIILFALLAANLHATPQCSDIETLHKNTVLDSFLKSELHNMKGPELATLYSNNQLKENMRDVQEILNILQPFAQRFSQGNFTYRQEFSIARLKVQKMLIEKGMEAKEASATVDHLLERPSLIEKFKIILFQFEGYLERENTHSIVTRISLFIATLHLVLPVSIISTTFYIKNGVYVYIPFASQIESFAFLITILYGSKAYRVMKNIISKTWQHGLIKTMTTPQTYTEGSRPWNEIKGEYSQEVTKFLDKILDEVSQFYKTHAAHHLDPVIKPTMSWARIIALESILFVEMHNKQHTTDSLLKATTAFIRQVHLEEVDYHQPLR